MWADDLVGWNQSNLRLETSMKNLAAAVNLIITILSFIGKAFFCGATAVVVINALELGLVGSIFIWLGAIVMLFTRVVNFSELGGKRS